MKADLHVHTAASDGQYMPEEVARLAKARGLEALAVTDHDTIAGVDRAAEAGRAVGIQVIRGVELSAKEGRRFHILGYHFSADAPALTQLCQKLRAGREDRKYQIIDFLKSKGVEISLSEVEELAGAHEENFQCRADLVTAALVRRGYAADNEEAFCRYLDGQEFRQQVSRFKAEARVCVEAIKEGGGKTSLAHPYQMGLPDDELEALVKRMKGWGLDAIECFYPKYTAAQQDFYLRLTEKYGLRRTGGSDFHGELVKPDVRLACLDLDLTWLTADA
jgi:hypothetical protein